jgi:hypothetical protein
MAGPVSISRMPLGRSTLLLSTTRSLVRIRIITPSSQASLVVVANKLVGSLLLIAQKAVLECQSRSTHCPRKRLGRADGGNLEKATTTTFHLVERKSRNDVKQG